MGQRHLLQFRRSPLFQRSPNSQVIRHLIGTKGHYFWSHNHLSHPLKGSQPPGAMQQFQLLVALLGHPLKLGPKLLNLKLLKPLQIESVICHRHHPVSPLVHHL